jgi:hypothetical protein
MVTFNLNENATITDNERKILTEAKKKTILYDEDSPELTADMERAFIAARKSKPYHGERLTLYVSPATMEKIKHMGTDYIAILSHLLDKAVDEYRAI